MRKFFLVLCISIIAAAPVSIGSCVKYSADGQSCQQCISNYHLYDGSCYVDILGCKDYQFGNICHQCDKNYILVNNMCCDMVCMSKIFSKFKKQVKQEVIANNTEILNELIPFAQAQYLNGSTARLVAIQVREYQDAKRFFLLYEFYEEEFYSKRLIVDYVIKTKKYIVADWSLVRNSWKYGNVDWTEVQDDAAILLLYPALYPSATTYSKVVARKAILSQVDQYEVATVIGDSMLIRTLYVHQSEQVILQETSKLISESTVQTAIPSNSTQTQTTTQNTTSQNSSNTTLSQPPTTTFHAYELKYQGMDILAELDANEPLIAAVDKVKAFEGWNHSLTLIVEAAKIPDVLQFTIIGQNKETGSIIKFVVKYIQSTKDVFIVSVTEQIVTVQKTQTNTTATSPTNTTTANGTASSTTTSPTVSLVENKVYVIEEGCTTHTYYISPLAPEIEAIATQLKQIKDAALANNSANPIIASPGLNLRRLVVSENCQGSNFRQVAYVEGDTTSTKEYFTYYFETQLPTKTWYYLGVKNKTQSSSVYQNPYAYPIYVSDPSFLLYPSASLFYQTGISTMFNANLSQTDQQNFAGLTATATTEKDRSMGKMTRFAIDGVNANNERFRMTGWRVLQPPTGLVTSQMISLVCPQAMITQTIMIGTSGPTKPTTENQTTTTITTSVLGDQTVNTTSVEIFLSQDDILREILAFLIRQKPITKLYELQSLQITEYDQSLEYHLVLIEKNINETVDFVPSSSIRAVVVHDKKTHENILISFEVIEVTKTPVPTPTTPTEEVHGSVEVVPNDEYVVVDVKTQDDYQKPADSTNSTNSTTPASNQTTPSTPSTTNQTSTETNPTTPSEEPSTSANTTQSNQTTPTTPQPTTPTPELHQIDEKERIKQMIDSILQQLTVSYELAEPTLIQALQQVNIEEKSVKLTLIVYDSQPPKNYSVVAIGSLDSQNDPTILSVKVITQEVIDKLTPTLEPVPTCEKKTINTVGQEVCLDEASSSQTDITPAPSTPQTNTNSSSSNTTEPSSSGTPSETTPTNSTPIDSTSTTPKTQAPSDQALHLVEEKSFQETIQSDGEIRKIYVNPSVQTLSEDVKNAINTVLTQQKALEQSQLISQVPKITVKSIEVAATTIYTHYAVTIKIVYTTIVVIRRYYIIIPASNTTAIPMGHEDLPITFDPSAKESRAFNDLFSLENNAQNQKSYETVLKTLNSQSKTTFVISNIIYYRYRVFPVGYFVKVTIKNDTVVGNAHLISTTQPQQTELITWHEEVISEITKPAETTTTSVTSNTTAPQTTNTSTTINQTTIPSNNSDSTTQNQTSSNSTQSNSSSVPSTEKNSSTPAEGTPQTPIPTPEELINQQETTTPQKVVISLSLEEKLGEALKYLSQVKQSELSGASLQQYAATEDKSVDGTVNAIQFDLYFLKFINDQLLREFICSLIRHEADGKIDIALFLSNDISLGEETPAVPETTTNQSSTQNQTQQTTTPTQTTIEQEVKNEQVQMNSDFVLVDPNELYYPEAINLIEQDSLKSQFDEIIDLASIPANVDQIIKFLRAKYFAVLNSGLIRVVRSQRTSNVQRFRLYFFKELPNNYELYRTVLDYNTETIQTKINVASFELYASNHQIVVQPSTVRDQSLNDDTDIAYGYVLIDLQTIDSNVNVQNILKYLSNKYHDIVLNKKVIKIEELKLLDGRINYKVLYRDPVSLSEFKFIIFYQPKLQKVLVLNSVNLPHHSQYNLLSQEQQKSDSLFSSVLSYVNSIHPEISGFAVRSVSKATEPTFSEYQVSLENKNKRYKSLVRVASNNVDLSEIDFSEMVEISLDHYRLDQFDQLFIMNYQKLSEDDLRTNSKLRIVLSYLHNSRKIDETSKILGAASKPLGLGFLFKVFVRTGLSQQIQAAEVYIEAYSDKVSLKSFRSINFDEQLLSINAEEQTIAKIISLIKQKTTFLDFAIQSTAAKDFMYGTLYKLVIMTKTENFDLFVYHDHSSEEISLLQVRQSMSSDQCNYLNTVCESCKSSYFRIFNNKCVQTIQNCSTYESASQLCKTCDVNSELVNGICIEKANCGALCQIVSL